MTSIRHDSVVAKSTQRLPSGLCSFSENFRARDIFGQGPEDVVDRTLKDRQQRLLFTSQLGQVAEAPDRVAP
ncbi:MAG: hypothetical protein D6800_09475 [Candidatus Zixiibacteriota bacterium]|nr:MAG: hypothetical protein D6800_09475 [candidate division Zixibacteria bacterium]